MNTNSNSNYDSKTDLDFRKYFLVLNSIFKDNNIKFGREERKKCVKLYALGIRDPRTAYLKIITNDISSIRRNNKLVLDSKKPKKNDIVKSNINGLNTNEINPVKEQQYKGFIYNMDNNPLYLRMKEKNSLSFEKMMIVAKYFQTPQDFINLTRMCKKYKNFVNAFHFNPVSDSSIFVDRETLDFHSFEDFFQYITKDNDPEIGFNKPIFRYRFFFEFPFEYLDYVPVTSVDNLYAKGIRIRKENNPYSKMTGQIELPLGVKHLEDDCFKGSLPVLIKLPSTLETIGNECFSMSNLREVDIPEGVISLGNGCFQNCGGLTRVSLPSTLNQISEFCFANTAITKIIIPEGVTILKKGCLANCKNLTNIVLPSSLITIEPLVFANLRIGRYILPENLKLCDSSFYGEYQELIVIIIPFNAKFIENEFSKQRYCVLTYRNQEELNWNIAYGKEHWKMMFKDD